ncbi:MAG: hypothetical protein LLG20_20850 [Acidobacteriales bacterium]|nr:hypothetical protein [Terriglobales bacterium]
MTSRRSFLASAVCLGASAYAAKPSALRFQAGPGGEFTFDTGLVRGKLRSGGKSFGLGEVVHVPSGSAVSRSYGLCGHYRVFTKNHRYGGGAWDWPSEAELLGDGSVKVHWPAASDRPFVLEAHYRWSARDTFDVVTTVKATADLADFESFLASYFAPQFTNSMVYAHETPKHPAFLAAEPSQGVWQMFPQDEAALEVIRDGRWAIPPSPVQWAIRPPIACPLGMRRNPDTGLTAVLMAPQSDSYAVATPHQKEGHFAMYLAQFGRTVKAGETARARARLVIGSGISEEQAVKLYRKFTKR